jgi:DNA mismatch endonuclease (patch repair protein)
MATATAEGAVTDNRSTALRSKTMSAVRQKNTGPEMAVRRLLHSLGYRYRLHQKALPGHPDLVFVSKRKVVFVHGCFWHGHGCSKGKLPKSRLDYWEPKIEQNKNRDRSNEKRLMELGWNVCIVWQCEIADPGDLKVKLTRFLSGDTPKAGNA